MNKAEELNNTISIVKSILKRFPAARNSDMLLYVKVCEQVNPKVLSQPFWYALTSLKDYNLPCIETVRRTRQKLQAKYPELAADENVEAAREGNIEAFRDFARG